MIEGLQKWLGAVLSSVVIGSEETNEQKNSMGAVAKEYLSKYGK